MNDFMKDNKFYIGANYWASHNSINMWADWNGEVVEEDLKKLSSYGVKTLRMFLTWDVFQPIRAIMANMVVYEYRMMPGEKPLPDTEAGRAGVSEEACGHFKEFCDLADKYGIKLIVGLITGHMSFRAYYPEALVGKNALNDPISIKWEVKLVKYIVKRFKNEPAIIAWDLGNECSGLGPVTAEEAYNWTQIISSAIRESDTEHPVVSGFADCPLEPTKPFNIKDTAEIVDITTTHPYQIFSPTYIDPLNKMRAEIAPAVRATILETMGNKPCFVEEVGSIGYTNNSEKTEAEFLKTMLWSTWAQGNRGCFWWCAFDQGQFDYAPYDWNNFGSDYGLFRADGSAKPVADVTKSFADFLDGFEYAELPKHTEEAVCIVPREVGDPLKLFYSVFILAKQANLDLHFTHAEEKLPDAKLYILPSIYSGKPIFLHRLNELLEKVKNGATLYFSLGDTLFRRIPELTGLTIASRERGQIEKIELDGNIYNFGGFKYNIETVADSCEVLARTEDGRPVFVKNKYGKGNIYFLSFALEWQISDRAGIFKSEDCTPYYKFYEKFAAELDTRAVKSLNPCVLTTEHIISENKRVVIAINYADADKKFDFDLRGDWKVTRKLYGSEDITAHDAFIFEVEK